MFLFGRSGRIFWPGVLRWGIRAGSICVGAAAISVTTQLIQVGFPRLPSSRHLLFPYSWQPSTKFAAYPQQFVSIPRSRHRWLPGIPWPRYRFVQAAVPSIPPTCPNCTSRHSFIDCTWRLYPIPSCGCWFRFRIAIAGRLFISSFLLFIAISSLQLPLFLGFSLPYRLFCCRGCLFWSAAFISSLFCPGDLCLICCFISGGNLSCLPFLCFSMSFIRVLAAIPPGFLWCIFVLRCDPLVLLVLLLKGLLILLWLFAWREVGGISRNRLKADFTLTLGELFLVDFRCEHCR